MLFELLFIFFARIIDVSLGTVRMILVIRGEKYVAAVIGFFEILVYVVALGKVIGGLNDPLKLFLYCLGFASGVVVGSWLEERLALGYRGLQVTTSAQNDSLVEELRQQGYAVTTWQGKGLDGDKLVMSMLLKRDIADKVASSIRARDEGAFIIFLEPKSFYGGFIKKK